MFRPSWALFRGQCAGFFWSWPIDFIELAAFMNSLPSSQTGSVQSSILGILILISVRSLKLR